MDKIIVNLDEMSITDLKAFVYDQVEAREVAQHNIDLARQLIAKKENESKTG